MRYAAYPANGKFSLSPGAAVRTPAEKRIGTTSLQPFWCNGRCARVAPIRRQVPAPPALGTEGLCRRAMGMCDGTRRTGREFVSLRPCVGNARKNSGRPCRSSSLLGRPTSIEGRSVQRRKWSECTMVAPSQRCTRYDAVKNTRRASGSRHKRLKGSFHQPIGYAS